MTRFIDRLLGRLESSGSPLCVGLDSRYDRLPEEFTRDRSIADAVFEFNKGVIDATHDLAMGFKMNLAFYAGFGAPGLDGLRLTTRYLKANHPDIPLFADCKRSEMGESVQMVRQEVFDDLGLDCVMVTPWFGFDTVRDYLTKPEHGVAVYVHDSNPSAYEFQDLIVVGRESPEGRPEISAEAFSPIPLYEFVAKRVATEWNTNGNVIVEAGLTYPRALRRTRDICGPDMPILVAGLGAQGGRAEDLRGLFGTNGRRLFVNVSRGISFPTVQGSWKDSVRAAAEGFAGAIAAARSFD